jgi:lipopolysaccharide heptosyltransferase II
MLTDVRRPQCGEERNHQAFEYLDFFCPNGGKEELEPPQLSPPATAIEDATKWLPDAEGPWVGLLPGAARGPSKQWPEEHFIALGKAIQEDEGRRVVVLGGEGEIELCQRITQKIGAGTLCLAGRTTLESWAAVLERCAVVVANDSGGMHLAAAMATPVVALFGMTDPAKTGPLGPSIVLQHSARASRDIPRESQEARFHLASIHPNEVYDAVELVLTSSADEVASL